MQEFEGTSPNGHDERGGARHIAPWLAIAAAPVLFGLSTWLGSQPGLDFGWWLRIFGLPIIAIQVLFILTAISRGARPLGILLQQANWIKAALLGLAIICVVDAAVVSPVPIVAIDWSIVMALHLLFALSVAQSGQGIGDLEAIQIWTAVVVGACLYVAAILIIFCTVDDPRTFDWEHIRFGTNNIRHTGHYSVVGAWAALALSLSRQGLYRILLFAAGCLCLTLAFWSGTRGAVVAVWVGLIVAAFLLPLFRSARALVHLGLATLIAGATAWVLPTPHPLLGLTRIASSLQTVDPRSELWSSTWELIVSRPVFGYGPGQLWWLLPENPNDVLHPHNVVLQSLLQWGAVGTILLGALVLHVVRCLWKRRRTFGPAEAPAILIAASLGVMAMYDGSFAFTYPTALFAFSIGWLFRMGAQRPGDSPRLNANHTRIR